VRQDAAPRRDHGGCPSGRASPARRSPPSTPRSAGPAPASPPSG